MLPKNKRISREMLKEVLVKGAQYHAPHFFMRSLPSSVEGYAVTVSKKVAPKAVVRNKIRRRTYSIVRALLPEVKNKSKNILSAKSGAATLSFQNQREEIAELFRKAKVI